MKAVQTYLDNPEFDSDLVKGKSLAAGGLCAWTINVIRFYHVYCDVEPKRISLAQANAELAAAEDKLSKIKAKIQVCHLSQPLYESHRECMKKITCIHNLNA